MKYIFTIITLATVLLLAGCTPVEDPGNPCADTSDEVTVSFRMMANGAIFGSRADALHPETDSELTTLEDGIDMKDLGIFVFAKPEGARNEDGSPAPENLVLKTTTIGTSTNPDMMVVGSPGAYTVTMVFKRAELHTAIGMEITEGGAQNIQFRILILANSSSPGTNAQAKWNQIDGKTYSKVIEQLGDWNYAMNYLYNADYTGTDALGIYSNRKRNIPMFGTAVFSVTQDALLNSRPDDRLFMGEIELLRSLAKVRVVDNIENKDADGFPKIIGVEFVGSQSQARQLPYNAPDYVSGNQVHTPNIYSPDNTLNPENPPTFRLGTIEPGVDMTPAADRKGLTRIGYVPEQKIGHINGNVNEGRPMFRITVRLKENDDGTGDDHVYEVPMTGTYDGQTINRFGDNILRNHVYTLSVNYVGMDTPVSITVSVAEWTPNVFNLDFNDTLVFMQDGKMTWRKGTYQSINEANGNVVLLPWKTNADGSQSPVPAICSFGFSSPIGAKWQAFLVGDSGAFRFVDATGNVIGENYTEGNIQNKLVTLYIVSTDKEPTENHTAKLLIVAHLPDGSIMEAHTSNSPNYDNFTLVQNQL